MIALVALLILGCVVMALWMTGVSTGVLNEPGESKARQEAERKRRDCEATMTASERWKEDTTGAAPSAAFQEFLIAKYGDNGAACDAWSEAGKKGEDGYTALAQEMIDWRRNKS